MASNANHFLDGPGLSRVWSKIKSYVKGTNSLVGAKNTIGTVKNGSSITNVSDHAPCPIVNGIPYYKNTDTTYRVTSDQWPNDGLMSYNHYTYLKRSFCAVNRSGVSLTFTPNEGTTTVVTMPNAALNSVGVVKTTSNVTSVPTSSGYHPCPIVGGVVYYQNTNTTYSTVGAKNTTGLVKNGSDVTNASGYTACPIVGGIPYYKEYTAATASASGLMTAAQFKKLSLSGECIGTKKGAVTGTSYVNSATHNSSGSWIALGSGITFGPGVWLLIVTAIWASSSTGRRGVSVASGESSLGNVNLREDVCAATGGQTHNRVVTFVDGDASYIIGAYQSSGGSTTVSINYSAVRVG